MQKIIKSIIVLLFIFVLLVFYNSLNRETNYSTDYLVGNKLTKINLKSFDDNKTYTSKDFKKSRYTLINFWASWCLPCLVEHPILMALKGKENLTIIGINYKDNEEDALEFLREQGDPYDFIGIDKDGFFGIEMGITGVPETFIVDENGKVMIRHVGPIDFGNTLINR